MGIFFAALQAQINSAATQPALQTATLQQNTHTHTAGTSLHCTSITSKRIHSMHTILSPIPNLFLCLTTVFFNKAHCCYFSNFTVKNSNLDRSKRSDLSRNFFYKKLIPLCVYLFDLRYKSSYKRNNFINK